MALSSLLSERYAAEVANRYFYMVDDAGFNARSVQSGILALQEGEATAMQRTGYPWSQVHYWMRKFLDQGFHPLQHGGARNWKYPPAQQYFVESVLWKVVKNLPCENPVRYCAELASLGIPDVSPSWVTRAFRRWKYSRKKVQHVQRRKFTTLNICRYLDHVMAIPHLDPTKLKFLDESRFETRRVRRSHGYSERGRPIYSSTGDDLRESYTVTLVSTHTPRSLYLFSSLFFFVSELTMIDND